MNADKRASDRTVKSDLKRVDAHEVTRSEYDDLRELTDNMHDCGTVTRAGLPVVADSR